MAQPIRNVICEFDKRPRAGQGLVGWFGDKFHQHSVREWDIRCDANACILFDKMV